MLAVKMNLVFDSLRKVCVCVCVCVNESNIRAEIISQITDESNDRKLKFVFFF